MSLFALRGMQESDRGMIASSWLKNYQPVATKAGLSLEMYCAEQPKLIDALLVFGDRPIIAVSPQDTNHIYGWVVGRTSRGEGDVPIIHYVYVKRALRGYGIGRALVEVVARGKPALYSHQPPLRRGREGKADGFATEAELVEALAPGSRFCPYLLWKGQP